MPEPVIDIRELSPTGKFALAAGGLALGSGIFLLSAGMVVQLGLHEYVEGQVPLLAWPEHLRHLIDGAATLPERKWTIIAGLGPTALVAGVLWQLLKPRGPALHGNARLANGLDIKRAGLRAERGLIFGWTGPVARDYGEKRGKRGPRMMRSYHLNKRSLLCFGGSEHMIVYAPTRSGKGVGVVVPVLLTWDQSCVVLDIKKENFNITAGFRAAHGQKVFLFDPFNTEGRTSRYNPLSYVRKTPAYLIDDLQRIAAMLFPVGDKNPFYDLSARQAFIGMAAFLAECPGKPFTIGQVFRDLTGSSDLRAHVAKLTKQRPADAPPLSMGAQGAINDFLANGDEVLQNIRSTVTSRLNLWLNPIIDAATSESDFDFADLRRQPMSIYFGVSPDDLERIRPLTNLFFQQCLGVNMRELPEHNPALKHQVAFVLDEFASLGRMDAIKNGLAFLAGFGLRLVIIIQAPSQLEEHDMYGKEGAQTIMANCGLEVVYPPKDLKVSRELEERIGSMTMRGQSESRNTPANWKSGSKTKSESDQKRSVILAQDLRLLPQNQALAFCAGSPAIQFNKLRYYCEGALTARLLPPPEIAKAYDVDADGNVMTSGLVAARLEQTQALLDQAVAERKEAEAKTAIAEQKLAALRAELSTVKAKGDTVRSLEKQLRAVPERQLSAEEISNPAKIPDRVVSLTFPHQVLRLKRDGATQEAVNELFARLGIAGQQSDEVANG
jgi:type IV secretion system protein VirD4